MTTETNVIHEFPDFEKLVENCDYNTKLAVTAWVFKNIVDNANEGGSFRYLIYDRLGFDLDAYVPLCEAGGMEITNEFDLTLKNKIKEIVKENKIETLKDVLGLCDCPDCFSEATCGFPIDTVQRKTCWKHLS